MYIVGVSRVASAIMLAALLCQEVAVFPAQAAALFAAQRTPRKKRLPPPIGCGGVICVGITADRVTLAPGESAHLQANATDPDGDVLTFTWTAEAGLIIGSGSDVQYNAPPDKTGRYIVTAVADDGHGHTAECNVALEVVAPSP